MVRRFFVTHDAKVRCSGVKQMMSKYNEMKEKVQPPGFEPLQNEYKARDLTTTPRE